MKNWISTKEGLTMTGNKDFDNRLQRTIAIVVDVSYFWTIAKIAAVLILLLMFFFTLPSFVALLSFPLVWYMRRYLTLLWLALRCGWWLSIPAVMFYMLYPERLLLRFKEPEDSE